MKVTMKALVFVQRIDAAIAIMAVIHLLFWQYLSAPYFNVSEQILAMGDKIRAGALSIGTVSNIPSKKKYQLRELLVWHGQFCQHPTEAIWA